MTTQKAVLAVVLGLPTWALALDLREPPLQAMTVWPSVPSDPGGARQQHRLRDALRQPVKAEESPSKPYLLSVEERQRLREQLRSQTAQAESHK